MAHGGPSIPVFLKAWQPIITPLSSVPYINSRLVLRDQRPQRLTTKSSYQWWSKHSISVLMPVSLSNPKAGLRDKAKPCGSPVSKPYCSWWSVWPVLCTACSFLTDGRTNQAWCPTGGTLCIYRVRPGDGISFEVLMDIDGGKSYTEYDDMWGKMKDSRIWPTLHARLSQLTSFYYVNVSMLSLYTRMNLKPRGISGLGDIS